jgi:hypothetical protein
MRARAAGYILIETAVALVLLSVGAFVVHRTVQEAIRTRGQAQDFTRARFLLEQRMSELLVQPVLAEKRSSGRFSGDDDRFTWTTDIRRVNVPVPRAPLRPRLNGPPPKFEFPETRDYLARVVVTVSWERSGVAFSESYETLLPPHRLWQPPRRRG